jgi:Mn-dependent DtxR family transcriptional regulator
LKERAHLSADQLYAIAKVFRWEQDELEYAGLLLAWERSGLKDRKESLRQKIDAVRKAKLESKANLKKDIIDGGTPEELTRFFLNPFYYLLNVFLGIPRFAQEPARIASCLNVHPARVSGWLKDLTRMKLLEAGKNNSYKVVRKNFHLPRESPLCEPHQQLMLQLSHQHLQSLPEDRKYSFTVTFSADPEARERIQREFLAFLKKVEPIVKDAPAKEIYGMRFDLFDWSHERDRA